MWAQPTEDLMRFSTLLLPHAKFETGDLFISSAVPKHLTYVPSAKYRGKPLFYSYRTCDEVTFLSSTPTHTGANPCPRVSGITSTLMGQAHVTTHSIVTRRAATSVVWTPYEAVSREPGIADI
mmetsp:Transcript_49065/g.113699  ORF Transcript_49065/g.113699 Transcript_49065/m.113699 type:complete len:123 (+) Transcript_49065:77-445(+)